MFRRRKTLLYFAPHQDDELLTMGIDISTSIKNNDNVHVILCTDGSKSYIRKVLNNGKTCSKHEGVHAYELTEEEFTQARDREFLGSCTALGVPSENVHIFENRFVDGSMTAGNAETAIKHYLKLYGDDCIVCTICANTGPTQHKDHKSLGRAAENLLAKNVIKELKLFIEPYHAEKIIHNAALLPIYPTIEEASLDIQEKIKKAIASYSYWNPDEQRYAVGYHSVTTEFKDFLKEMKSFYFVKKSSDSMTFVDELKLRYKRWLKLWKQEQYYYSLSDCPQPDLGSLKGVGIYEADIYKDFCEKYELKFRGKDAQRLADGSSFWCLISSEDVVVSTGWLAFKQHFYIGETDYGFDMKKSNTGLLYDFNTKIEYRGNGYYPLLLKFIASQAKDPDNFIIYTEPDNVASDKGIRKAGFHFDGTLSASDHSLKQYLQKAGYTSIKRKNQLWGLRVIK